MTKNNTWYIEIAGITCATIGFFLRIGQIGGFSVFLMSFGFGMLLVNYLSRASAVYLPKYDFLAQDIAKPLVSITYSIVSLGILGLILKFNFLKLGQDVLEISTYLHLILVILLLFAMRIADSALQFESTKSLLIRSLVMLAVVYMFYLTSQERLQKAFTGKKMESRK